MSELEELLSFRADHLAWPVPNDIVEFLGPIDAALYLQDRKDRILRSEQDPLRRGYVPKIWDTVYTQIKELRSRFPSGVIKIIIFGGNRSTKSRFGSNYVLDDCVRTPGRRWWCCDSTEAMARTNMMRLMYEQLPPEWKNLPTDNVTKAKYSIAGGFSENLVVWPNRSEIGFKFYSMDIANLPGPELDGVWADELIPLPWVETLTYRLVNRNGIMIITFTPELGWNETFGYFYEGAQILEESEGPLLPKYDGEGNVLGHKSVPRVMQCNDPTARIIFFHTSDNPFGNYPGLVQQLEGKSEEEILIRAYGLCTKAHTAAFPMFNRRVHVITEKEFKEIEEEYEEAERYHLIDPCDGRNWFMCWVICPGPDKWIVYREWPSHSHKAAYIEGVGFLGPWATTGAAADGVRGGGQKILGFGLEQYIEEILSKEGGEEIKARYIDSRYATQPKTETSYVTSLIEQLSEVGMDFLTMVAGKGRIIGLERTDGSVDLINSALFYDIETDLGKYSAKLGRVNVPQLQIVETCPNVIYALEHWTGMDGQKGACKDPIDVLRGAFLSSVNFVGEDLYSFIGGGIPR